MPPRRLGGAWLSLWPGGSARAVAGAWSRPPFPEGVLEKRACGAGRVGRVRWTGWMCILCAGPSPAPCAHQAATPGALSSGRSTTRS